MGQWLSIMSRKFELLECMAIIFYMNIICFNFRVNCSCLLIGYEYVTVFKFVYELLYRPLKHDLAL